MLHAAQVCMRVSVMVHCIDGGMYCTCSVGAWQWQGGTAQCCVTGGLTPLQVGKYSKRQAFVLPGDITKLLRIRTCSVSVLVAHTPVHLQPWSLCTEMEWRVAWYSM